MKTSIPSSRFFLLLSGILLLLVLACGKISGQNVANYSFSAVAGTYSQIQGIPGAVSPALSGGTLDDGWFNAIPIGFTFVYDGVSYTSVSASTNGWMTFNSNLSSSSTANNLATGTPRPVIAPLWDDLALNASGSFSYYLSGTSPNRVFTVEWMNERWSYLASSAGMDFQVKLYENNRRVEFIYRQQAGAGNSASASIGIAGSASNVFLSLNSSSTTPTASSVTETTNIFAKPSTGQTYRFDHYPVKPVITSVSPLSGQYYTSVIITGSGFDASPASDIVFFGATKASVVSATYTTLNVVVPADATYENISVTILSSHLSAFAPDYFNPTFPCGGFINNSSFNPAVNFSIGTYSRHNAIVDVDGDGKSEIAVTSNFGVSVFRNTTTTGIINAASFSAAVNFPSSGQTGNVAFADLDGDGKKDMVTADYDLSGQDSICVFRNTSVTGTINSSSFTQRVCLEAGMYPFVTIGDIDGDGKPELITSNEGENTVSVYRNLCTVGSITTASFAARVNYAAGVQPWCVAACDIDGDGKTDVIATNGSDNTVSVYRNTATSGIINAASLAPRVSFATGSYPLTVKTGDIDGDGNLDLVCANQSSSNFSVLRNTSTIGNISFAAKVDIANAMGNNDLDLGDIDGDGKIDVATSPSGTFNSPSVKKNTSTPGNISFIAGGNFPTPNTAYSISVGDLDRDGKPELVTPNGSAGNVSVLQNIISSFSQIAPLTVLTSVAYCDDGTWKTFCDPTDPTKVLAAIKDNGNNLGTLTVSEYEDGAPGYYSGTRFLARHFKITPTIQPSSSVQVRLYFTNAELTALQGVDPSILSAANLSVTKYDGPTEDGVYYPGDATSLTWYPQASIINSTAYGGKYLEFTIASFSEFWIHGGTGVLPVELLDFNAVPEVSDVQLSWSTATETDNDFFTIEKTRDGINFETVAVTDGSGTTTQMHSYNTIDLSPYEGTSYYRLKQTDFNGHFTYSDFKAVNYTSEENLFSVFPNPSSGNVSVACPGDKDETVLVEAYDPLGKQIISEEKTIGGLEHEPLYFEHGVYTLVVTRNGTRFVRQLVIL